MTALVAASLSLGGAAPAQALGNRAVHLDLLDQVNPGNTDWIAGMVVDTSTHRAYISDGQHSTIEVYDVSGKTLSPVATIPTGLARAGRLAIDEASHRLVVGEDSKPNLSVVDVDPTSPTVNTVIKAVNTGGLVPRLLEMDGQKAVVVDYNQGKVATIDLVDGSSQSVDVGVAQARIAIDQATHRIYLTQEPYSQVVTIEPSGSTSVSKLPFTPYGIALSKGSAFISTSDGRLRRYDPATWTETGLSPVIGVAEKLRIDGSSNGVFAVSPSLPSDRSPVLVDTQSLVSQGVLGLPTTITDIALDAGGNRLLATDAKTLRMYDASPTVERIGGADRFEVSAATSRRTFAAGKTVYVASGTSFPDALSASAAAGKSGGPVLLVENDRIPSSIVDELGRLRPSKIVVVGGSSAVSSAVEASLSRFSATVERIGGADRFATSADISLKAFAAATPVVYVASGENFPDALSGSAAAGLQKGPVLLVRPDEIPTAIATELNRLTPGRIVLLGGTSSVSAAVGDALAKVAPTTRIAGADRYVVSAGIANSAFSTGAPTVYIASGAVFPDALSGSAAAIASGAPVLLVPGDQITAAVQAELDRLNPAKIVVLGGARAVSDTVLNSLKAFVN